MTRIAIIGAGAIGGTLGALLARDGQDVTLLGRAEHVAAMRRDGLRVDGALGAFTVPVAACESLDFRPDLALLTVKTQQVAAAVREHQDRLTGVPLVTLQNGVRSDDLVAELLPREQLLSGVVMMNAQYLTPGRVTISYPGSLVIGRPFGPNDDHAGEVARLLGRAVPTRLSDNILGAHWLKLIVNLNNALAAITDRSVRQIYEDPYLGRLGVRLMREGMRVAARSAIRLESLPDLTVGLARLSTLLPVGLSARVAAAKARRIEREWPLVVSTLQSIRRGSGTEIDYLNGEVVRQGERVGAPAPLNAAAVELVHRVEQTGRFLSADEVREAMAADQAGDRSPVQPRS